MTDGTVVALKVVGKLDVGVEGFTISHCVCLYPGVDQQDINLPVLTIANNNVLTPFMINNSNR